MRNSSTLWFGPAAFGISDRRATGVVRAAMDEPHDALLERALGGEREATRALIAMITPVMQARVARVLLRRSVGRPVRQEVEDLVQEGLVALFADDAKALRRWRVDGGMSLRGFAGMVAERRAISKLRARRWAEEPTDPSDLASPGAAPSPEQHLALRQVLDDALTRLRAELSPRAFRLFELLWVEEQTVEAACAELSMTRDAVYQAKRRIKKLADEIAADLQRATPVPRLVEAR